MLHYEHVNTFFFFFNDTATTEIYTLSLHDALPILPRSWQPGSSVSWRARDHPRLCIRDRKSTRLNSSHLVISYAVFCLKKKKRTKSIEPHDVPIRQLESPDHRAVLRVPVTHIVPLN